MASVVHSRNRVRYIEPSNVMYNDDGSEEIMPSNVAYNNSLENLDLALDLQVVLFDRKSCGVPTETGGRYVFNYSTNRGTMSFLKGTEGVLTTNYTDVNLMHPDANTEECLGIESIDIQYQSWMYPDVTIKFVDVRGATVMSKAEKEYQDRDIGGSFSLYKALFTYPYPLFKLKVKGFYGRGATYYLSVENVKMDFNADTGNFEIIVHFIGMMFRVYTDLPMTYVAIAPYTEDGSKYWSESVSNGKFQFHNPDGSTANMMTYIDLRKKLWDFVKDEDRLKILADGETEGANLREKKAALSVIVDSCPVGEKAWIQDGYIYDISHQGDSVKKAEIADRAEAFLSALKSYDEAWNKDNGISYYKMFEGISGYTDTKSEIYDKIPEIKYVIDKKSGKFVCNGSDSTLNEAKYINNHAENSEIREVLKKHKEGESRPNFIVYVMTERQNVDNFKQFIDNTIKPEIESLDNRINSIADEYRNKEEQYLEEYLGFRPSIKNMYDLAFAHMDTFVHIFNNCTSIIRSQIEANDKVRNVSTYGGNSDVESGDSMLPPFPALYKEKESAMNGGVSRNVEIWPEDIPNGSDMVEVAFVKSFISGAKKYFDKRQILDAIENATNGTGEMFLRNFIPLTTYDFMNFNNTENPYEHLNLYLDGNNSKTGFAEDAMGTFALRALYYLATNGSEQKTAELFGKVEAVNFFKAMGLNGGTNNPVFQFALDEGGEFKKNFIETVKSTKSPWDFQGCKTLLSESNNKITYTWRKQKVGNDEKLLFPVAFKSFEQCKADFINGKNFAGKYINVKPDSSSANNNNFKMSGSTYISDIRQAVNDEISSFGTEVKGAIDGATDILDNNKTLSAYVMPVSEKAIDGKKIYDKSCFKDATDFKDVTDEYVVEAMDSGDYDKIDIVRPALIGYSKSNGTGSAFWQSQLIDNNSNLKARAYIFLYSVPAKIKNHGLREKAANGVEMYLSLLREGAYYWRKYEMDPVESGDPDRTDPIKVDYEAKKNQLYYIADSYGFTVVKSKNYISFPDELYYTTNAKERAVIKGIFENWAVNEYKEIDKVIGNSKNYINGNSTFLDIKKDAVKNIQGYLREVFFKKCTVLDYLHGFTKYVEKEDPKTKIDFSTSKSSLEQAFKSFSSTLKKIYQNYGSDETEIATAAAIQSAEDPFNNKDIRLATYLGMKQLYDKWLCSPYRGSGTWKMGHKDSEFESFTYIDSFYHDIGLELMVNATQMSKSLDMCLPASSAEFVDGNPGYKNKSLYEFLAEIAQNCGGILLALPQKIGGCNEQYMADMFRAMPYASDWETDSSSFIFLYTYKESEHLGNDQYKDDGFDLTSEQVISSLSDKGYEIPAFGVSYAKQNQAYFKNIKLSTENSIMTEEAIQATMNIASKGSDGPRLTTAFGQDLYRVRTSYAYQCEFDMMGDVQIMPLMYFQLNNIPFWRGAYHIIKVFHKITDGDMVTHVTGIRANRNSLPMAAGYLTVNRDTGHCVGGAFAESGGVISDGSSVGLDSSTVPYTNDNITGNRDYKLSDPVDFNGIVDASHPIVCLTPCHGPFQSDRWMEWNWSNTLIDNYIIPKLRKKTYKDGTKINIQKCNKNGSHTDANSCRMTETENLIKKYGSSCVISINPHWNVGFATYNVTMHGLKSNNRRDSETLAKQFVRAADAAKKKSVTYDKMPEGLMSGKVVNKLSKNDNIYALKVKCPCVETMNWFYDYPLLQMCHKAKTSSDYTGRADWKDKDESGRYILAEGWLYDEQGMNTIADIHVNAIMAYLEIVYNAVGVSNGTQNGPYNVPNTQAANINWLGQDIPSGINLWNQY